MTLSKTSPWQVNGAPADQHTIARIERASIEQSRAFVAARKAEREQAARNEQAAREAKRDERAATMATAGLSWSGETVVDEEYEQWKREMGLDQPLTSQQVEQIAAYELKYIA